MRAKTHFNLWSSHTRLSVFSFNLKDQPENEPKAHKKQSQRRPFTFTCSSTYYNRLEITFHLRNKQKQFQVIHLSVDFLGAFTHFVIRVSICVSFKWWCFVLWLKHIKLSIDSFAITQSVWGMVIEILPTYWSLSYSFTSLSLYICLHISQNARAQCLCEWGIHLTDE